ncbi:MAG: hypothetical protein HY216_01920 [Candidatus Rokubacteria bacterium]|nr:hypothetical protein [Candidatus Rokubacteria bacterium]
MRKEYDFSEGVPRRARAHPPEQRGAASSMATYREANSVDNELTPAQIRELRRRAADLDDVTRYLLVSQMTPRFALYYNVSDDVYVMNDPRGATLFKRHKTALAVKALLGGSMRILRCKSKRLNGVRVPMLGTVQVGRRTGQRSSPNQRLQPTAGAKRRVRGRSRSAGRG